MDKETLDLLHESYINYCKSKGYRDWATKAQVVIWEETKDKMYSLVTGAANLLEFQNGRAKTNKH